MPNSASRRRSDSSACSARTQGAMKTGHAPDESLVSVLSDNSHIVGIRFGTMGPWSQPYFMDLVRIGEFVLAYLPNPTSYGHDSYTIGYSKDWGLEGCVEILWQPHQIWSYESVKSAAFHGFGLGWRGAISPELYNLWIQDLHHWIQVLLQCVGILWQLQKLWGYEPLNSTYVSLIWFARVKLCLAYQLA